MKIKHITTSSRLIKVDGMEFKQELALCRRQANPGTFVQLYKANHKKIALQKYLLGRGWRYCRHCFKYAQQLPNWEAGVEMPKKKPEPIVHIEDPKFISTKSTFCGLQAYRGTHTLANACSNHFVLIGSRYCKTCVKAAEKVPRPTPAQISKERHPPAAKKTPKKKPKKKAFKSYLSVAIDDHVGVTDCPVCGNGKDKTEEVCGNEECFLLCRIQDAENEVYRLQQKLEYSGGGVKVSNKQCTHRPCRSRKECCFDSSMTPAPYNPLAIPLHLGVKGTAYSYCGKRLDVEISEWTHVVSVFQDMQSKNMSVCKECDDRAAEAGLFKKPKEHSHGDVIQMAMGQKKVDSPEDVVKRLASVERYLGVIMEQFRREVAELCEKLSTYRTPVIEMQGLRRERERIELFLIRLQVLLDICGEEDS